jgi:hypothetical protein
LKQTRSVGLLLVLMLLIVAVPTVTHADLPSSNPDKVASVSHNLPTFADNDWVSDCVDCPRWFESLTDRSVQLDRDGRPHVAFGGDHLYYAWHDGTGWNYATVDPERGVGAYASLALDESGKPHIAYHDKANGELKHAWVDGTVWHVEVVDTVGTWHGHGFASLALDGANRPHVSYFSFVTGELQYARHDGTDWQMETIATPQSGDAREYSALALDGADRPHIIYFDDGLVYAWHDGSDWQTETADGGVDLLGYPSLALDGADQPHVSYFDAYPGHPAYDLKYASRSAGGWHIETIDQSGGWYSSLALDDAGRPHVSYTVNGALRYAWNDGTQWQMKTITTGDIMTAGWGTALALENGSGHPHVLYRSTESSIRLVKWDGVTWQSETLAFSRDTGLGTALVLDGADRPHISYYGDGLKYGRYDGATWQVEVVDGGNKGGSTSLALDSLERAHISYQDWSSGDLMYARYTGSTWLVRTIDSAGYVGEYNSLELDSLDQPHISYFDRTKAKLKYARRDGTVWQVETVPIAGAAHAGMYSSLALDTSNRPHISFEADGDLRYARHDGVVWQVETVDGEGVAGVLGRYSSLALDSVGWPHIGYYDTVNGRLRYAWKDEGGWHVQLVPTDTNGLVGKYTSLALDDEDWAHIGFYDATHGDIKTAILTPSATPGARKDATWQIETVESTGDVGQHASLALDGDGYLHLSYYDASSRNLRYARSVPELAARVPWQVHLPVIIRGRE